MESNDEELKLKLPCDCNDSEEVVSEEEEESDIAEEQEPLLVEEEKPVVVEEQIIIDFAKEPEQTQPQQQTKQYINSILKSVSCIFKRFNFFR
jgi:hypothetical protein